MNADTIEYELGVPIPGRVLPQSEWARTAVKRLPEAGPLDWAAIFGRTAPVVLDLGCGNGRFTLMSAVNRPDFDHFAIDFLPVVIRYATRRANQRGLHMSGSRSRTPRPSCRGMSQRRASPKFTSIIRSRITTRERPSCAS